MNNRSGTYGWFLFSLGAIFYGYEYALRVMPSVVMPELIQHFNIGHAGFGYIAASYYYAYVLFQVPAGILIDRFGPLRLMTHACLACVVGVTMFAMTHVYSVAILGRFLIGGGSVFAFVGALSVAKHHLPKKYFAFLAGFTSALGTFSAIFGDITITHIIHGLGWIPANLVLIAFGVLLVFLLIICQRRQHQLQSQADVIGVFKLLKASKLFLTDIRFWLNAAIGCLIYLPTTIFAELWGIPYLRMARDFTDHDAAFAVSMLFLGYTMGAPFAGWLSEKVNNRNTLLFYAAIITFILSLLVIYLPTVSYYQMIYLLLLLGFSYGSQSLIFAIACDLVPEYLSGSVLAFTNMITMLGGVFMQPLVGHIIDAVHHSILSSYQLALSVMPAGVFISIILSYIQLRYSRMPLANQIN